MHVSLDTADLDRAVDFYTRVFGFAPTKQRADSARFELDEPQTPLSWRAMPIACRSTSSEVA